MNLRLCLSLVVAVLVGCRAAQHRPPAIRWLDPTARFGSSSELSAHAPIGLRSMPHLTQDVAVRQDGAVVIIEPDHRWLVTPEEVLRRAFSWARVPLRGQRAVYQVELSAFELQRLASGPSARVACTVTKRGSDAGASAEVEVIMPAADATIAALADAMGKAAQELVARVIARTRRW